MSTEKSLPVLPPSIQSLGLNKIATGTAAANSEILNQLYQLLITIKQMALKEQQDQVKTSLAIAWAEGDAIKTAGYEGAEAAETQGIGQTVGSAVSGGVVVGGIGYSNFGPGKTITAENTNIKNLEVKEEALKPKVGDPVSDPLLARNAADAQ